MAAPTPVVRATPAGVKMEIGFRSLNAFARYPALAIWEMDVGSPGYDGGEQINTTTQHNTEFRSFAARALKTLTEYDVTYAYDPKVYDTFRDMINVPDTITRRFPDGSTLTFYGYLKRITKNPQNEEGMPGGTMTIVPTNYDHVNKAEAAPVVQEVVGT